MYLVHFEIFWVCTRCSYVICFPLRFELHFIWIWILLISMDQCICHVQDPDIQRMNGYDSWPKLWFDGPWEWVSYDEFQWFENILDFHPLPVFHCRSQLLRWHILQVKCPKQRQQKGPQSDHERKIAAVLSAWNLKAFPGVEVLATISQLVAFLVTGLRTLTQSLGGGFKHFLNIHLDPSGKWFNLTCTYFSNGLVKNHQLEV